MDEGGGSKLVVRYNWTTSAGHVLWDAPNESPALRLEGSGIALGAVGPLPSGVITLLDEASSARLGRHLVSSSFVTVKVKGEPDAIALVEEEGAVDKPSLLERLPAEEILRYWSLLTDDQKNEFFDKHAGDLNDEEIAKWVGGEGMRPHQDSIFATFAHVYLSFGNLERAVRKALDASRSKEAVDRLFSKKFDSLKRLIERLTDEEAEKEGSDAVGDYITMLCARQLLTVLKRDYPAFAATESRRFELIAEARKTADALVEQIKLDPAFQGDRAQFFQWLEDWFLRRAVPAPAPKKAAS